MLFSWALRRKKIQNLTTSFISVLKGPTDIRFVHSMSKLGLDIVNHMVKFSVAFWIEMFLFFRYRKRCAKQQISKSKLNSLQTGAVINHRQKFCKHSFEPGFD